VQQMKRDGRAPTIALLIGVSSPGRQRARSKEEYWRTLRRSFIYLSQAVSNWTDRFREGGDGEARGTETGPDQLDRVVDVTIMTSFRHTFISKEKSK